MNLKNKILLIAIVLLLSICIFNTDCYATQSSSLVVTLPSINDYLSDNDKWFIYFDPLQELYFLYVSDGNIVYNEHYNNSTINEDLFNIYFSDHSYVYRYSCGIDDDSWFFIDEIVSSFHYTHFTLARSFNLLEYMCASNFDLFFNPLLGEEKLVFQNTPIPSTLKGITSKTMVWGTMNQILRILPIVMIVVVSYLALRKALKMLSTFLRNS